MKSKELDGLGEHILSEQWAYSLHQHKVYLMDSVDLAVLCSQENSDFKIWFQASM